MNVFDLVVVVLLAASIYFGYKTGIVTSLFYVLSGFVGMWTAQEFSNEPKMNFYILFFASAGAVVIVGFIIGHLIKKLPFIWLDHFLGIVLGIVLGFVIVGTVVFPVSYHFPKESRDIVARSFTAEKLIPKLQDLFPRVKQFTICEIQKKMPLSELPKGMNFDILSSKGDK